MLEQIPFAGKNVRQPRKMIIRKNVLSREQCEAIKDKSRPNLQHSPNNSTKHWDINFDVYRLPVGDDCGLTETLTPVWEEAFDFFKFELTHIEQYEIKEYTAGGYVTEHVDQYYGTIGETERKLTMIIQLSDGSEYENGDTIVTKFPCDRSQGSMVIFPSFFPHSVDTVTAGSRWSLNCWAWGPYWK